MINTLVEDDAQKIAVFFGGYDSSDGKEGSKDGSDSDNLGFLGKEIYSDEEFAF